MSATTQRDIALDASGDFDLSTGDLQITRGAEAIRQSVQIHLQFFLGEWFLDPTAGIPWWQKVFKKVQDPNVLQPIFRNGILAVTGVSAIEQLVLTFDHATRVLNVAYQLDGDVGLLDGSVPLSVGVNP